MDCSEIEFISILAKPSRKANNDAHGIGIWSIKTNKSKSGVCGLRETIMFANDSCFCLFHGASTQNCYLRMHFLMYFLYVCMYHLPHKKCIQAIIINIKIDTIQYFKVENVKGKHP